MKHSPPGLLDRVLKRSFLSRLEDLAHGELTIEDGGERYTFGRPTAACPVRAAIEVRHPSFYRSVALGGSIGAAEAFMDGAFECDHLTAAVRILAANRAALERLEGGLARLAAPLFKWFHLRKRNTRDGSRRNIAAHYDLGNDFFRLFLDESMMYSAAIYEEPHFSLEEAARAKIDRLCQKLELSPADHLLEIGTGWGAFAVHAARHYGCRVTTTTISQEQHRLAVERVRAAGLEKRVTVLQKDYRDLEGAYDKLVSIEMIEAVGHQYFDSFFEKCSSLLKPDGMMALQAITIAEQTYAQARRSVDFIQRYVFPGSCLPSQAVIADCVARKTDFRIFHMEDITPHYVRTLREWRQRFLAHRAEARAQGLSKEFLRLWEFYLCYCEGGFEERVIGDIQVLFTKPLCRRESLVPPLSPARALAATA